MIINILDYIKSWSFYYNNQEFYNTMPYVYSKITNIKLNI